MNPNFKITIPEPCNEDWDKMTPDAIGRFCSVCNKSVIDFTNKLPDEIQHFFLNNQGQTICGRFKSSQLDSVNIRIPSRVLFSQTQYNKIFLLALFIVMGTSLFSCSNKNGGKQKIDKIEVIQDKKSLNAIELEKNGYKKKPYPPKEGEEVKENIPSEEIIVMGPPPPINYESKPNHKKKIKNESLPISNDTTQTDSKKNETNSVKIGNESVTMGPMPIEVNFNFEKESLKSEDNIIKNCEINIPAKDNLPSHDNMPEPSEQNDCKPQLILGTISYYDRFFNSPILTSIKCNNKKFFFYTYLHQTLKENAIDKSIKTKTDPSFPNSIENFYLFLANQINISQNVDSINKTHIVFDVETDGTLTSIKIYGASNKVLDEEIIRVLKTSPKWIPGEQNGQKIKMRYYFQMQFKMI